MNPDRTLSSTYEKLHDCAIKMSTEETVLIADIDLVGVTPRCDANHREMTMTDYSRIPELGTRFCGQCIRLFRIVNHFCKT